MRRGAGLVVGGVLAACSAASDPAQDQYTLDFPSTASAVATETVQVLVFDPSPTVAKAQLCATLLQKRKSNQSMGKAVVESTPVSPCDLSRRGSVTVPFGEHAIVAIARKENKDYMLGCTFQTVAAGDPPATVYLTPVSSQVLTPATKCPALSNFCGRNCPP